jgi:PAS domain S-box-containing protein
VRLAEAEQTLEAIRAGAVDALVVSTDEGEQVFGLRTADHSYRRIIESIHEGAATLTVDGTIFYANRYLSELLGAPLERLIGSSFGAWLAEPGVFDAARARLGGGGVHRETQLRACDGRLVPVYVALSSLPGGEGPRFCVVLTDLRAQKREEALVASEQLSRSILEQAADVIVVCDASGAIVRASEAAKRLCAADPVGRSFEDVFGMPPPTGSVSGREIEVRWDGGRAFVMLLSARPLLAGDGPVGSVVTLTDISERKRVEDAERRAREAAEAANRAKDEFLAMLAHELRNPLFAVRNAIEVARSHEDRTVALAIGKRQVDQLARLVDDLLDVARIQSGKIELLREPVEIASVVGLACEAMNSLPEGRRQRLSLRLAPELFVEGDPARLEQVFTNLLSNASKYTPAAGHIQVDAEHDGKDVVVRVRDDGIGIAPELLPHVFDLFSQGTQGLDRATGGLGIGLTVTRRLVELHGGRIEARSAGPGTGAEFEVRLPLANRARAPQSAATGAERERGASVDILLVEDNADAAESLAMLLELHGHRVRTVGDAHAALAAASEEPPEVALVDIGLPGMDGYELARRLRARECARVPLLVALTGYGQGRDKERAAAAGFDAHLVKPVDFDALCRLLSTRAAD